MLNQRVLRDTGKIASNVLGLTLYLPRYSQPFKQAENLKRPLSRIVGRALSPDNSIEHRFHRKQRLTPPSSPSGGKDRHLRKPICQLLNEARICVAERRRHTPRDLADKVV